MLGLSEGPVAPDLLQLATTSAPLDNSQPPISYGLAPSMLTYDSQGRVAVEISATDPNALVGPLQSLGANVTGIAEDSQLLDAYVPVDQLPNLAALTGQGLLTARAVGMITSTGSVDAQSDQMTEADRLRAVNSLTGSGVTVGVLSDSYNNLGGAAADIASGDLSTPVFVRDNVPAVTGVNGEDEGRAMMQIVHDVAPGSPLAFATAEGGQAVMAQNIMDLAKPVASGGAGAKVITDDISYFSEPFYQDGTIAQAVNSVASSGVVYTAAAGNIDNNAYENTSPSLTSDSFFAGGNFINFGTAGSPTSRQSVRLSNGQAFIITLEWDNPFFNAAGDTLNLSIFLVDPTTQNVVAAGNVNTIGSGQPVQVFSFQNLTGAAKNYDILILAAGGTPGRLKWVNYGANSFGDLQINTPAVSGVSTNNAPTMNGHAQSASAIAAGAAPYFNQTVPESFSSFGPTTILFSADGLTRFGSPQVRAKPDVTGIDGVRTTFFPSTSSPFFFGTSAATPDVAGLAAQYLQGNPAATPAQVKAALIASGRAMQVNANFPTPSANVNQVGAGLVSGFRAVNGSPTPASIDYSEGFDALNGLNNSWFNSSRFTGQVQVTSTVGTVSPNTSPNQLVLSELDNTFGFGGVPQADLLLAGVSSTDGNDVGFSFQSSVVGALAPGFPMPATFNTFTVADGVAISADGVNWTRVEDLSTASTSYTLTQLNLSSIAAAAGIPLTSTFRLRFQGVFLAALPTQGLAFDSLQVSELKPFATPGLTALAGIATGSISNIASFTDGANPVGTYTATIDWGDGSPTSSGMVTFQSGQLVVSSTGHTYPTGGTKTFTVTLNDTATGRSTSSQGTATVSSDVTSQVTVARSGLFYQRATGFYVGTITITNTSGTDLSGSAIRLGFQNLTAGVTVDPTLAGYGVLDGLVFLSKPLAGNKLAAGQSIVFTVRYKDPSQVLINFTPDVFLDP
jgi:hypothetical protein